MDIGKFISHYPYLYHMADADSWGSIRRYGLLSTTALLDLFEIRGDDRRTIESCRRTSSLQIRHKKYGVAKIRDQKPLKESLLNRCLVGCKPKDWYETLNNKVFFWPTREKILSLLAARAYRSYTHIVVVVDSAAIIEAHLPKVTLSPINTGATVYRPTPRGLYTFVPFSEWPDEVNRNSGRLKKPVVEVALDYAVYNIVDFVTCVVEGKDGQFIRTIWKAEM